MNRRALLISNPGEVGAENYCKGVFVDVRGYVGFLKSPQGGVWGDHEIMIMNRPDLIDVKEWIKNSIGCDYAFVVFTGHGWYSAIDKDRILELKKDVFVASREFISCAPRSALIFDCCQKVYQESLQEKAAHVFMESLASLTRMPNPIECKKLFLSSILAAPIGYVRMYSCSIGEFSYDDPESGARYNSSLLEFVKKWAADQSKRIHGVSVLSVVAAHDAAAQETSRLTGGVQNPIVEKPKSTPYFPIAVFA